MHIILATVGTDGDVFPHLGLGTTLQARGHEVTLAAPEPYRDRALAQGLGFCSLVTAEEMRRVLADRNMWHPLRSGPTMARWGAPMMPRQYEALAELTLRPDSVLVANPGLLPARLIQEKLKVPMASLLLQPGLLPSCDAPPEMPGGLTLPDSVPRPLGRAYWLAVDAAGYLVVGRSLNRFAARLGLPPVHRLFRWWLSPELVIGLFPSWYAPPAADWPPQLRLTGFGRYDGAGAELPEEVRDYCQAGPPPVAFTLGTGMAHAADFFRAAVEVCALAGVRGLLLTKFPELIPNPLPSIVCHCAFAPFRQLLPLCAAVVHHGGIGTTAAALEAGCPQLVLPLAWDQPDNAARVVRLGVGVALRLRKASSGDLARALARLMSPDVRARCRATASLARHENGFQAAAELVEQMALSRLERKVVRERTD